MMIKHMSVLMPKLLHDDISTLTTSGFVLPNIMLGFDIC